jgi:hypothetical protein
MVEAGNLHGEASINLSIDKELLPHQFQVKCTAPNGNIRHASSDADAGPTLDEDPRLAIRAGGQPEGTHRAGF